MIRLCSNTIFVLLILVTAAGAKAKEVTNEVIDFQVRLAWAHASPGPIDGSMGMNTRAAIKAFQRMRGLDETGELNEQTRQALESFDGKPTVIEYEISKEDVAGPFLEKIPSDMMEMAKLKRLSYTSPLELLSEKFHMDPDLVQTLNKGRSFDSAGAIIRVANVADLKLTTQVNRIEVDKKVEMVRAYDDGDKLIASYPATIGSDETPSPDGQHKVVAVARNPSYTYDPRKLDFKGIESNEKFTIPPGPNNPVGLVWIDLDAPTYGIHGSPEPAKISRQNSHGCVRLTNWDALELAEAVHKGVEVDFVSGSQKD